MERITQKTIAHILRNVASMFEKDQCGMDEEEMIEFASLFLHKRMNIEKTCQHYGISRATLNRWQQQGKMPQFHKDSGGKDYLYLDECEEYLHKFQTA